MKLHCSSIFFDAVRWQQRSVKQLRQAWQRLQRQLAEHLQPRALVLIPIRAVHPQVTRLPRQRTWRD